MKCIPQERENYISERFPTILRNPFCLYRVTGDLGDYEHPHMIS